MAAERPDNVKQYYHLITEIDIGQVARELLGSRIVQESGATFFCDCPNHKSQSHRSFQVSVDRQCWYCFGCGVGGDVLQLVEFVQSGCVTSGRSGPMPASHRQARDYLAEKVGLPPLSNYGISEERIAQTESARAFELRVQGTLTETARYYHGRLKASPKVLEWLIGHYGISEETIDSLLIGYSRNSGWKDTEGGEHPGVIAHLTGCDDAYTLREIAGTGAFNLTRNDDLVPAFDNRLVFPYWSRGRVVFMIARKTPWTAESDWEQAKYKKLKCHDEHSRRHIAPCIDNGCLYNEDCLLSRPERIVITEGVTDCISLIQHGFSTISPVTVQVKDDDWRRILPKLAGVKTVYICQDNEVSEAGLKGALKTARHLADNGIETRLVVLPLEERHSEARRELRDRFGLDITVDSKELSKRLATLDPTDKKQAEELLGRAKIDVNEYFASGHTAADFEELLSSAVTPLEYSIDRIPHDAPDQERNRLLEPVLEEIAEQAPLEQTRLLKILQERCKSRFSLAVLKAQVKAIQKEQKSRQREQRRREKRVSDAPAGSCRACVEQVLLDTEADTGTADYTKAAEAAYNWFVSNGARFFRTRQGDPFMFFNDELLWMDSSDRARKRLYSAMVYQHTGLVQAAYGGRVFIEVLANLATQHGEVRDHFSWLHTDVARHIVYFNLNNERHEIARITPDGVEIIKNGSNADGVILESSGKMEPVQFLADADEAEADRLIVSLILDNLACSPENRFLIWAWLSCFLLMDFAGTRPMTRFEGSSASGKTTAAKLITTLLYGQPQQKKSTDAANYSDGARNPLIALDNVETNDLTEELVNFMLTSITGIAKEKRKSGTDTDTVVERTKCLVNTTGIEPLKGELTETLSRTFIIRFNIEESTNDCFLEAQILAQIRQHRDLLISVMMKRTSHVLAMLKDQAQGRVMTLLHSRLGRHGKHRCNDYLSLMYLTLFAGKDDSEVERATTDIQPQFLKMIQALNEETDYCARESNPIATALAGLFKAYANAIKADEEYVGMYPNRTNKAAFSERYQIEMADVDRIEGALARELFIALKRVSREYNLSFNMTSVQQFAQRFANDMDIVRAAGFEVSVNNHAHRVRTYDIKSAPSCSE
ncbi:MAG: CHC2 zinc finger domain-containing protein [Armatimonadota bacterium]|nr:CHC2 zinc finger domain-containing protein [Armatimonadota bacterium]